MVYSKLNSGKPRLCLNRQKENIFRLYKRLLKKKLNEIFNIILKWLYLLDEESDTIEEVAEITDTVVKEVVPVVEVDAPAEEEETKPKTIGRYTYLFFFFTV